MEQPHQVPESDEIDLIPLLQKIWKGRKTTIKIFVVFMILGVIIALNKNNLYTATSSFIPKGESRGSIGGSLGSLASLAGINLGGMSSDNSGIPPTLYPMLVQSNSFIESLLMVKVPQGGDLVELQDYLNDSTDTPDILGTFKKYTIGLPGLIKKSFFGKKDELAVSSVSVGIKKLTLKEESIYKSVKELIALNVDKKEGFITLTVVSDNPEVSAIIALNAQLLLQKEVINFKIKNAQELLTFTETLYAEKKIAFEVLQDELATFRDQHQNISSGLFENKLSRLESELTISYAVNQELAKQVEQARIQLRKDTPIFTIIDPVVIPNQRTRPKRALIVFGFTFLGVFLSLGYVLIKGPFTTMRKQILEGSETT